MQLSRKFVFVGLNWSKPFFNLERGGETNDTSIPHYHKRQVTTFLYLSSNMTPFPETRDIAWD